MPNLSIGAVVFVNVIGVVLPASTCDFFKVNGGYLESRGAYGGNIKCSSYPSVQAAKEECLSMVGCDGFSFGPWGSGLGGCLKANRQGGFTASPKYVGYHKTLMGCCGNDRLERGQCRAREIKRVEKLVSRGKPTTQSSDYKEFVSSLAVDGNKKVQCCSSCTHTLNALNQWWSVDLLDTYDVSRVEITNQIDACCWKRLSNFVISVGDNPYVGSNPSCLIGGMMDKGGQTKSFPCRLRGRFVTISIVSPQQILTLCEVEVFAMILATADAV